MNLASGLCHWLNLLNATFSPLGAKTNDDNTTFEKIGGHPYLDRISSFPYFFLLNWRSKVLNCPISAQLATLSIQMPQLILKQNSKYNI
jgi:hypothetical protein